MHETRALSRLGVLGAGQRSLGVLLLLASSGVLGACQEGNEAPSGNEPSPNASILPSPLASQRPSPLSDAGKPTTNDLDGGTADAQTPVAPVYFELDGPVAADTPAPRDSQAMSATAAFSWVPRAPGSNPSRPGWFPVSIEFAPHGRMRLVLESEFLPLPAGSEFRSRVDRYGHVLVWPNKSEYRVLAPGTIRALFQERRADVGPMLDAIAETVGNGRLLGVATHKDRVKSPMGELTLEQARLADVGSAGQLLCRFLLELVLVKPDNPVCLADYLPLKAEYAWQDGGQLTFAVTLVTHKVEIQVADFLTPPRRSTLHVHELPAARPPLLVSESAVAALSPDPKAKPSDPAPGEESRRRPAKRGLTIDNQLETPRFVLINDEYVAFMAARSELRLERLKPGAYSLTARDFLGVEPVERWAQKVPGRRVMGARSEEQAATAPAAN